MQKSGSNQILNAHRQARSSTTLNRKYVSRPIRNTLANSKIGFKPTSPQILDNAIRVKAQPRPIATTTTIAQKSQYTTAVELKEQAIKKALIEANQLPYATKEEPTMAKTVLKTNQKEKKEKKIHFKASTVRFGIGRILLALGCAIVAVIAIVSLVNVTMPDVSLKVAAMQTGIDDPYPSYIPRGYGIMDATSENNKITLIFKDTSTGASFSLTEERSSWDSTALLSNYVKDAYGDNYTVIREQGLTIYVSGSNATWVNGGVFYVINATSGNLTKKQISAIAASL